MTEDPVAETPNQPSPKISRISWGGMDVDGLGAGKDQPADVGELIERDHGPRRRDQRRGQALQPPRRRRSSGRRPLPLHVLTGRPPPPRSALDTDTGGAGPEGAGPTSLVPSRLCRAYGVASQFQVEGEVDPRVHSLVSQTSPVDPPI